MDEPAEGSGPSEYFTKLKVLRSRLVEDVTETQSELLEDLLDELDHMFPELTR